MRARKGFSRAHVTPGSIGVNGLPCVLIEDAPSAQRRPSAQPADLVVVGTGVEVAGQELRLLVTGGARRHHVVEQLHLILALFAFMLAIAEVRVVNPQRPARTVEPDRLHHAPLLGRRVRQRAHPVLGDRKARHHRLAAAAAPPLGRRRERESAADASRQRRRLVLELARESRGPLATRRCPAAAAPARRRPAPDDARAGRCRPTGSASRCECWWSSAGGHLGIIR